MHKLCVRKDGSLIHLRYKKLKGKKKYFGRREEKKNAQTLLKAKRHEENKNKARVCAPNRKDTNTEKLHQNFMHKNMLDISAESLDAAFSVGEIRNQGDFRFSTR